MPVPEEAVIKVICKLSKKSVTNCYFFCHTSVDLKLNRISIPPNSHAGIFYPVTAYKGIRILRKSNSTILFLSRFQYWQTELTILSMEHYFEYNKSKIKLIITWIVVDFASETFSIQLKSCLSNNRLSRKKKQAQEYPDYMHRMYFSTSM